MRGIRTCTEWDSFFLSRDITVRMAKKGMRVCFSILTVVLTEVPNLKGTVQVAYHAELNR